MHFPILLRRPVSNRVRRGHRARAKQFLCAVAATTTSRRLAMGSACVKFPVRRFANAEESGCRHKAAGEGEVARCFAYLPHRSLPFSEV